jgi:hypothetical protein
MARNSVINNRHAITFPTMNSIAALLFLFTIGSERIILYYTASSLLGINSKKRIQDGIANNGNMTSIINFDSSIVIYT